MEDTTTQQSDSATTTEVSESVQAPYVASNARWSRAKVEVRRITLNFTPSWFSVNMGTGITSILLHQLPYQFNGLGIISNIVFGINVVLFVIFLGISM
jgi:hypothetical protein